MYRAQELISELKMKFPGTLFDVETWEIDNGYSIRVSWERKQISEEVGNIIQKYEEYRHVQLLERYA